MNLIGEYRDCFISKFLIISDEYVLMKVIFLFVYIIEKGTH